MSEFSTFLEIIKNTKILDAAKDIGVNCEIFTSTEIAELYSNHKWSVIQNSQVGKVINAVPDISKADIPFPDYGGGAKYSIFENSIACVEWLRKTWDSISNIE